MFSISSLKKCEDNKITKKKKLCNERIIQDLVLQFAHLFTDVLGRGVLFQAQIQSYTFLEEGRGVFPNSNSKSNSLGTIPRPGNYVFGFESCPNNYHRCYLILNLTFGVLRLQTFMQDPERTMQRMKSSLGCHFMKDFFLSFRDSQLSTQLF